MPCNRTGFTCNARCGRHDEREGFPPRQTSLPAELRRRWGIEQGGEVRFIDLGDAALVVPGGTVVARQELWRVLRDRYEVGLASIDDPDLADQQP